MFTLEEQKWLLTLARNSIEHYLDTQQKMELKPEEILECGKAERGCFVTLYKDIVDLRGCIGSLKAHQALYLDVIDNAINAAFKDDRFFGVTKEELVDITIEISVLTEPQTVSFNSPEDLMEKLRVGVDGVIIKKGTNEATFLPQVWDEMLEKARFLSTLCVKAGLAPGDWQAPGVEAFTYQVEAMSE